MIEAVLKCVGAVVLVLGLLAAVSVLGAYPTKWLVNYLFAPSALVGVFGTPQIGFWQALALNAVCAFLIKGSTSRSKTK